MDGVLFHGNRVIPEALQFMQQITRLPHAFITNNPILLPVDIADKLQDMGFPRPAEAQIITSGVATALWLEQQKSGFRYFAIGAEGLEQALSAYGCADPDQADFVVVGEGAGIDYEKLTIASNLILKKGARLISTNPDNSVDAFQNGKHLVLPGGGALVAPLIITTGRQPVTIGKPGKILYQMALEYLNLPATDCMMIGDRPDTDIHGAAGLGMITALVRTGRFAPGADYPADLHRPDIDVHDLSALWQKIHAKLD